MVGVSAVLHLQARRRGVALIGRHGAAGLETSFDNAGLIERASIFPYLFPRDLAKQIRYALNLLPEAHYHLSALPQLAPWLWRDCRASAPERAAKTAVRPLIERSLAEHEALLKLAGGGGRGPHWTRALFFFLFSKGVTPRVTHRTAPCATFP